MAAMTAAMSAICNMGTTETFCAERAQLMRVNSSKFVHRVIGSVVYRADYYDPMWQMITACGIRARWWQKATMRRKPCPKCFPTPLHGGNQPR
jgi:hypothetical protein